MRLDSRRGTSARVTRRRSLPRAVAALAAASTLLVAVGPALADSSAWVSVNGGVAVEAYGEPEAGAAPVEDGDEDPVATGDTIVRSQLQFDVGVGTTPSAPIIVGGLLRISPTIGEYTDFALLVRGATEGFHKGPIGVAVDLGAYARADDQGSVGFVGDAVLGGPLGLQLTLGGHVGSEDEKGVIALLGVDLLRMTLYRESLLDWWPSPSRPDQDVAAGDDVSSASF